jgi:hypothetical protein
MKLIIGCPMYKRSWILHHWIKSIISQSIPVNDIGFIFEVSPDDTATIQALESWRKFDKRIPYFEIKIREDIPHFEHENNGRQWSMSKYVNMVSLRNSLLESVRKIQPEYYFSLDSDILLTNTNTIELLIAHIKSGADAVNPLMFMTPFGTMYPSVMDWRLDVPAKAFRKEKYELGHYFQSDVIMAAKMMSKDVYNNINYTLHEQGEDVGWSLECKKAGFKLYSASYIYAPHIMSEVMYQSFLANGDNRQELLMSSYAKV